jgi:UDP-2,4-diacetamido-2,4,6-trideoxy-beta-L-altropyranose hydrolase
MIQKNLIIRADAGSEIGTGHVMRCLALAQAWKERERSGVIFVMILPGAGIESRIRDMGFTLRSIDAEPGSPEDAKATCAIFHELDAHWCVIDGYQFSANYQEQFHNSNISILFIDDYGHCDHYFADIVLNQNIYANEGLYPNRETYVQLLLGTKYSLIRTEFLKYQNFQRIHAKNAKKILVTFGGSDPGNVTGDIVKMLKNVCLTDIEVIVIAGVNNPNISKLHSLIRDFDQIRIIQNVQDMPDLMAWADIAICAGGSTVYECAFMGLPAIIYPIAENQKPIVNVMSRIGSAIDGRTINILHADEGASALVDLLDSCDKRMEISLKMRELIDGKGALRVIDALVCRGLNFRHVRESDCRLVWGWINDPYVRLQSFQQAPIPLEEHKKWFFSMLSNPNLVYYIAQDKNDNPIGQVRFNIDRQEAVISILLDSNYRGRNIGIDLIRQSTKKFFIETPVNTVNAYVKCSNQVSYRAFIRAGYRNIGIAMIQGQSSHHLIQQRGK